MLLSAVLLTAAPSSAHRMLAQAPAFVPELQAAAHQALAPSFQAAVPTLQAVAEQLPASLPVDSKTKSLIQTAVSDLFSAIAYTGGDQQKLSQTQAARPEPGWSLGLLRVDSIYDYTLPSPGSPRSTAVTAVRLSLHVATCAGWPACMLRWRLCPHARGSRLHTQAAA